MGKRNDYMRNYMRSNRKRLPPMFERGRFVGVDGEGFAGDEEITVEMGCPVHVYRAKDHFYALLTDSDGYELYNPTGRLDTKFCLDFLLHIRERDTNAVPVVFGGSYDICHMLAFGLSRDDLADLLEHDPTGLAAERRIEITLGSNDYQLTYRPRKSFIVRRWPTGSRKYEIHETKSGKRHWKLTKHDNVTLWDVWGWFQASFLGALNVWLPGNPDWELIKKWKGNRKHLDRSEIEAIRHYNKLEVQLLVTMMDRVRESVRACDLTVTRWDGVGAVASAMYRKHGVKEHMEETPQEVFDAARIAYSGGHIEAMKVGFHDRKVHHYDINSAYPDKFRNLPSLAGGTWRKFGRDHEPSMRWSLVKIVYHYLPGLPFYPVFFRCENGSIIYPERGSGWVWFAEFEVAKEFAERFGCFEFRILAVYEFTPQMNSRPFAWVENYFERRKSLIAESKRTGIPNGEEKTLKLGYNACYGKTAQQVGARIIEGEIIPPNYFQLEWAGAVTAGCRAQLMHAAMQNPDAIISFATDSIFSTEPLDLSCPKEKILGEWDYQSHDGITMVMPGVYWLHGEKPEHHSRGYDKEQMEDYGMIHQAWKRGEKSILLRHERMITLGNACMSDGFWKLRGLFTTTDRELKINGENSKRNGISMSSAFPWRGLCNTRPKDHTEDYSVPAERLLSAAFPVAFLEQAVSSDTNGLSSGNSFVTAGSSDAFFLNSEDALEAALLA